MPFSKDIHTLFQRFGGQPEHYKEIGREEEALQSTQRWPLLGAVQEGAAHRIPDVTRDAPAAPEDGAALPRLPRVNLPPPGAAAAVPPLATAAPARDTAPPAGLPGKPEGAASRDALPARPAAAGSPSLSGVFRRLSRVPEPSAPAAAPPAGPLPAFKRLRKA
ncbi:cellulose biosynthesis protein BcsP [Caldimonas tepidiphila]|uniref:cellulose biosynthesis protein BcsP n=1 Tax=Caldimonas tepidiphila TaxID=2315841 RepID=UPI000E5BF090|nr:cellulose biosynthesis protein BcsP [Caldimonas tepidiphila]